MASSLRVNTIVPANGTNVAIGTAGGTITYTASVSGVSTFSSGIVVSAGTTAAPAISPTGDSNTGIFFPSADTVCIGEGGSEVFRVNSSGNIGINNTNPLYPLHINGNSGTLLRLDGGGSTGTRDVVFTEFGTDAYGGIIRYDSVADLFTFGTLENSVVKSAININRASGIVTTPHQPSFCASKSNSEQTTSGTIAFNLDSGAGRHNVGGHYSTSTGTFTCPVAGRYVFMCSIHSTNSTFRVDVRLRVNGSDAPGGFALNNIDAYTQATGCAVLNLAANDAVTIYNNNAGVWPDAGLTYFSGYLVG
jgi:hypothetical protein